MVKNCLFRKKQDKKTRRDFLKFTSLGTLWLSLHGLAGENAFRLSRKINHKPNIILVLIDDLGWADTSVQMMKSRSDSKSGIYRTPNLERLALQGMIFSNGYSSSPVCSPTRDSILYGKTPARLHHSILLGKANCGSDDLTIPRIVKMANSAYVTAYFGKWGCSPQTPEAAGYDVSDGNTDNWHGDWRRINGEKKRLPEDDPKRIFSVTKRAVDFMDEQVKASRPFFMQISHYAVHVDHFALKDTIEKYKKTGLNEKTALYAAMIENLDTGFGQLLDKIETLGISDNTYVIFTSDNGAGSKNGPLKGGKASLWEGGIRVPTVVRGPGIEAGSYCDTPVVGWDFLPTFADLAGYRKPLPDDLDGGSIRTLFNKGDRREVKRRIEPLIFHYPWYDSLPMSAIRLGDYKLVQDLNTNKTQLYNLIDDISETTDLTKKIPERAEKMLQCLMAYLHEVNAEKIEDLRSGRKNQLSSRIEQDRKEIEILKERMKKAPDEERPMMQEQIEMLQNRIQGNLAALERVENGLLRQAWP